MGTPALSQWYAICWHHQQTGLAEASPAVQTLRNYAKL